METLGPFKGIYRLILGSYWGYIGIMFYGDYGKEKTLGLFKGICSVVLGLY